MRVLQLQLNLRMHRNWMLKKSFCASFFLVLTLGFPQVQRVFHLNPRSEARMVEEARVALQTTHQLNSSNIHIFPKGQDAVILSGQVSSEEQRRIAIQAVTQVKGIHEVVDRLRVGPGKEATDLALENRISLMVERDPTIPADDIVVVHVFSGLVDIGGTVDTWNNYREVNHLAFLAGAKTVVNHLQVREDLPHSGKVAVYHHDPYAAVS